MPSDKTNENKLIAKNKNSSVDIFRTKKSGADSKPKTMTIVITGEAFSNAIFWVKIIDRLESELKRNAIAVKLIIVNGQEIDFNNNNNRTNGFIVIGSVAKEYLWEIEKLGLPVFLVDYKHLYIKHDHIRINNELGTRYMTEKILEKGHRNLLFMGDLSLASSIKERYDGIKYALEDNKDLKADLRILKIKHGVKTIEERDGLMEIIRGVNPPTAIIASQDSIAIETINVLKKAKINVPGEVSIVGFDNISESSFVVPKLTTVDVSKMDLAALTVETVIKKFQSPKRPNLLIMIEPRIIQRDSLVERRKD